MNKISLNGTWKVESLDGKIDTKVMVPGSLLETFEKNGFFGEEGLFYRDNNLLCMDYVNRDYVYTRDFKFDVSLLNDKTKKVHLVMKGLDTLTQIKINKKTVARTDNMHRGYEIDVTRYLEEQNRIEITFFNTLKYIEEKRKKRPIWGSEHTLPGSNHIRKSYCSYGWDWGPGVPDIGIWRDIELRIIDGAVIKHVHTTQTHRQNEVTLKFKPDIKTIKAGNYILEITILTPEGTTIRKQFKPGREMRMKIENPRLWWPNNMGDQPLYQLNFMLFRNGKAIDSKERIIGLRTLTVDRSKDRWGRNFSFKINGIKIFARGANYIPEDIFLTREKKHSTEKLIEDCVEANFNCIRIWGGGIYPADEFYDLCDRAGLIVWQDLMFACALYDINNRDFYNNIREEVRYNLLRIRHHASLGLICGNNEMEWGFEAWNLSQTNENRTEYIKQYQILFPEIVAEVCPEIFYWPASPSSGGDFESPNSPNEGDCHYWDVWHDYKDIREFENHYFRFMSEFGFESLPSRKTVESFTLPEDRNISSPVMEEHQKCTEGTQKLLYYISKEFQFPKDFESLVYVSQISQALALNEGIGHWRRNRGRCMGSIYWQLNDNWPVISWSSLDYYGNWKAAHYEVRKLYANILVSCKYKDHRAEIHLSNESTSSVEGEIRWYLMTFDGKTVSSGSENTKVGKLSSDKVIEIDLSNELAEEKRDRFLYYVFTDETDRQYEGYTYFVKLKYLKLRNPEVKFEIRENSNNYLMTLKSKYLAKSVELSLENSEVKFGDNYFDLRPDSPKTVKLEKKKLSLKELESSIRIRTLYDSYRI